MSAATTDAKSRGATLTILSILMALVAAMDITKPFGDSTKAGLQIGVVFFGRRLTGTPAAIARPLLGIILLIYAAGIWRMRRYALGLGYAYAVYVTVNIALYSIRNPAPDAPGKWIFAIAYFIVALGFTWGTAILLGRRKAELR